MIMLGNPDEPDAGVLRKAKDENLVSLLRNPPSEMLETGKLLSSHLNGDARKGRNHLKKLPYALCGIFSPAVKRKENFSWADRFFLWIRDCSEKDSKKDDTRMRITRDREVMMCFAAPGHAGLIVMFALSKRCHDAGLYSLFCRKFAREFARRHGLENRVSTAYADVTRECPVGCDRNVYYNPNAAKVDISGYADTGNPDKTLRIRHAKDSLGMSERKAASKAPQPPADPDADIMDAIRKKLGSRVRPRSSGTAKELSNSENIAGKLRKQIVDAGVEVTGIENIRGTLKIRARLGMKRAEVNVFPGRDGFTVLFAPLSGTDRNLGRSIAGMVRNFLADM